MDYDALKQVMLTNAEGETVAEATVHWHVRKNA